MALTSINVPQTDIGDLIATDSTSSVAALNSIKPEEAFSSAQMNAFKENLTKAVDAFPTVPSQLSGFTQQLKGFNSSQLSAALYDSGFDGDDINEFDFSIEGMTDISKSLSTFTTQATGGCEALLKAKQTAENLSERSLKDMDLETAVKGFTGSVGNDIKSILKESAKTVTSITKDLLSSASSAASSISKQTASSPTISFSEVQKSFQEQTKAFDDAVKANLKSLQSGIPEDLLVTLEVCEACVAETKKMVEVKTKNTEKAIEKLDKKLPDLTTGAVVPMKTALKQLNDFAKQHITQESEASVKTQSAATSKVIQEGNTDAKLADKENLAKVQAVQANEDRDAKVKQETDYAKNKTKKAEAIAKDVKKASDDKAVKPATNGRKVVERKEIVKIDKTVTGVTVFDEAYFHPGPFKAEIAKNINSLNYAVRKAFADAVKEFITTYYSDDATKAYHITINFGLIDITDDNNRFSYYAMKGLPAPPPGNTWHNFGMAIDVAVMVNGTWFGKSSNVYTGLVREVFEKHGITNPIAGDAQHFQPAQIPVSPKDIKNTLLIDGSRVNEQAVANLIA